METGEIKVADWQEPHTFMKLRDSHKHFDPVENYQGNFRRLTVLEFTTVTKTVHFTENFITKMQDLEFIVSLKMQYLVNVSEGTRVCPMVARLNPEWKCKEWDEDRTESYDFFGFDPNKASE
jgi:hypothetical protein